MIRTTFVLLMACMFVVAPGADAHEVRVVGGTTKLKLATGTAAKLATLGVSAHGTAFKGAHGIYSFHTLDDGGGGAITHGGALRLTGGGASLVLARPRVDIEVGGGRKELTLVVGGRRTVVATLAVGGYRVFEDEPGFKGLKAVLNGAGAALLNARLHTGVFAKGQTLGTLSSLCRVREIEAAKGEL